MLTEHEAWCAILDVLEGYGMPPNHDGDKTNGLCQIISNMYWVDKLISDNTRHCMDQRISRSLANAGPRRVYLAKAYCAAPRIPYVRRFIEETKP